MLRLAVIVVCLAVTINANIRKRQAVSTSGCYQAPFYNAVGQAFIRAADNNPPTGRNCGHYIECWKTELADEIVELDRNCAPGTMSDPHDILHGAPCSKECDPTECDCVIPTDTYVNVTCPYVRMANGYEFALAITPTEVAGTCGEGGNFDDTWDICTCTTMLVDCTCKIALPLDTDIETHGCNGGWVSQSGMPAMVTVSNSMGQFTGWDSALNNGPHLATYVIDGMFAGAWVHELRLTAEFTIGSGLDTNTWGIIDYGDCASGSALSFSVFHDGSILGAPLTLKASAELINEGTIADTVLEYKENGSQRFKTGVTYFAALVYVETASPSLKLFVMDRSVYFACMFVSSTCPEPVATANPKGAVTPRGCGFIVGSLNNEDTSSMFNGEIGSVSLDINPGNNDNYNILPCSIAMP